MPVISASPRNGSTALRSGSPGRPARGGRPGIVHDPCAPRRRGDRLGPPRDGADHPWRNRPLRRRAHPQCRRTHELAGRFEQPYVPMGPLTLFTIPVLRYMKTYGLTHEQLAMVSVVQREWATKKPRATFKTPITVDDVLNSRMIAYPFRLLQCCLVTDGGGALILVAAERARDFPQKPVYLLGTGESVETAMVSQAPRAPFASRPQGLRRGRDHAQGRRPSDDLRRLRASADLRPRGFGVRTPRRGRSLHRPAQYRPPAANCRPTPMAAVFPTCIPACTAMYALQESVRQMRGISPAQIPGARISVCDGVGGMFAASGTIIMSNEAP
jgi:Thiolase C-terminal domain-like